MNDKTLVFPIKGNRILLGMKKVRHGQGKWNGFGGGVEFGETPIQAAVRELFEESGLKVSESDLKFRGIIRFLFPTKQKWNQDVHIYVLDCPSENPIETEEMIPEWFDMDKIPYDMMWAGDEPWLSLVLAGHVVEGTWVATDDCDSFDVLEIRKPFEKIIFGPRYI